MSDTFQLLRDANAAFDHGRVRRATALFRQIIELDPASDEAIDAVYFLSTGERRPAQLVSAAREAKTG
jgi:hypothetical protein